MIETLFLILGLVLDTFILTSVNGFSVKENIRHYLGIETILSIVGVLIGSVVLLYVPVNIFKFICGLIIIIIQLIEIADILDFPEKVNALLLGTDSLVIFATLSWIYIPVLFVFESAAIILGSYIGPKIIVHVPKLIQKYLSNVVMILIGISLMLHIFV